MGFWRDIGPVVVMREDGTSYTLPHPNRLTNQDWLGPWAMHHDVWPY